MVRDLSASGRVWVALGVLALTMTAAGVAAAADEDVIKTMSVPTVERLMRELDLDFTEVDNNTYRFEVDGIKVVLFNKKDDTLQLYAGFSGLKITLSRINEWNRTKRFSRAYLDAENDPCLEADIDLTGGVTEGNFKEWVRTYFISVKTFRDFLHE